MIHHVVMFKFKEEIDANTRNCTFKDFKSAIENLPKQLPFIKKIKVGYNCNPSEKWDICLYSEFLTLEDVNAYSINPLHQQAATIIRPYICDRACTDYEG